MSNKNASTYGSITQDLSAGSPHKKAGPKGMSEMSYTEQGYPSEPTTLV
jgi:hypothetical protein